MSTIVHRAALDNMSLEIEWDKKKIESSGRDSHASNSSSSLVHLNMDVGGGARFVDAAALFNVRCRANSRAVRSGAGAASSPRAASKNATDDKVASNRRVVDAIHAAGEEGLTLAQLQAWIRRHAHLWDVDNAQGADAFGVSTSANQPRKGEADLASLTKRVIAHLHDVVCVGIVCIGFDEPVFVTPANVGVWGSKGTQHGTAGSATTDDGILVYVGCAPCRLGCARTASSSLCILWARLTLGSMLGCSRGAAAALHSLWA